MLVTKSGNKIVVTDGRFKLIEEGGRGHYIEFKENVKKRSQPMKDLQDCVTEMCQRSGQDASVVMAAIKKELKKIDKEAKKK